MGVIGSLPPIGPGTTATQMTKTDEFVLKTMT
jgi:hypothetical protein